LIAVILWSPDLTPLDFYLWGHLKAMLYQVKLQNMNHVKECIRDALCACNTRSVKANLPWVGETHPYALSM